MAGCQVKAALKRHGLFDCGRVRSAVIYISALSLAAPWQKQSPIRGDEAFQHRNGQLSRTDNGCLSRDQQSGMGRPNRNGAARGSSIVTFTGLSSGGTERGRAVLHRQCDSVERVRAGTASRNPSTGPDAAPTIIGLAQMQRTLTEGLIVIPPLNESCRSRASGSPYCSGWTLVQRSLKAMLS